MLERGRAIIDAVLAAHGFAFDHGHARAISSEEFARGTWVRGDRLLEVGCREELDVVVYRVGEDVLTHEDYMRTVLGPAGSNMFPCVTGDPLDGFRLLANDIAQYAAAFLHGPDEHFRQVVKRSREMQEERTTLYRR